ncbi:MAG: hypothetical protein BGO32_00015 [Bacteroidetes bacterium 37-13]|nr:MAG: hypothetical protein BGO32_00015 [Bacteroidetes bacterium 37-13]
MLHIVNVKKWRLNFECILIVCGLAQKESDDSIIQKIDKHHLFLFAEEWQTGFALVFCIFDHPTQPFQKFFEGIAANVIAALRSCCK